MLALATGLVACGGGSGDTSFDPQQVLDKTFNNSQTVKSADLNATLDVSASGAQSGNFTFSLSGPFESQGTGKVPKFDLTAKASGSGGSQSINFEGGLISTG